MFNSSIRLLTVADKKYILLSFFLTESKFYGTVLLLLSNPFRFGVIFVLTYQEESALPAPG